MGQSPISANAASIGCIVRTTVGCIASVGCSSRTTVGCIASGGCNAAQPRVVLHPWVAVLSGVRGIRNASLPDSCFFVRFALGENEVTGLPWAAAQTRLGTSPQTPSPLRGGLKPQNKKDPPQLSRSDSVVKGQGNSVPLRGLGRSPKRNLIPLSCTHLCG